MQTRWIRRRLLLLLLNTRAPPESREKSWSHVLWGESVPLTSGRKLGDTPALSSYLFASTSRMCSSSLFVPSWCLDWFGWSEWQVFLTAGMMEPIFGQEEDDRNNRNDGENEAGIGEDEEEEEEDTLRRGVATAGIVWQFSAWATLGFIAWVLAKGHIHIESVNPFSNIQEREPLPTITRRRTDAPSSTRWDHILASKITCPLLLQKLSCRWNKATTQTLHSTSLCVHP